VRFFHRLALVALALAIRTATAVADCPPDCIGGGSSPATDCLVEFGGIVATADSCTDGNPSCDMDATVNGVCTFPLSICLNVRTDPSCTVTASSSAPLVGPARSAVAQAVRSAIATLDPSATSCTAPGVEVPLKPTLQGVASGVARLVITSRAGAKRDRNKLKLTCRPSPEAPHFGDTILPIFAAHCAVPACHTNGPSAIAPTLDGGAVYSDIVGAPAANVPSLMLIHPGSVTSSYLARKILGTRIPDHTARMPQGCPDVVPSGGCLDTAEIAAIVAWIQTGAPNN